MQRKIMNLTQNLEASSLFPTIEPVFFQKTSSSQAKSKQQHEQKIS